MKRLNTRFLPAALLLLGSASAPWINAQAAQLSLPNTPLYLIGAVTPKVMLDLSRDHQLFYKAYTDYSDLDGNDTIETTYDHGHDYYGYFDSYKCYNYDSGDGRFEPATYTAKSGDDAASSANLTAKLCPGQWSGNFLNWVSMARIDIVRKLLYGGHRSTDSTSTTTLERTLIPSDGHAWAKHYAGIDGDARHPHLNQITPFTTSQFNTAAPTGTSISNISFATSGSKTFGTGMAGIVTGDQIRVACTTGGQNGKYMTGYASSVSSGSSVTVTVDASTGTSGQSCNAWTITNLSQTGITFCNLTNATSGGSQGIDTSANPPVLRVAKGNYALWAVADAKECQWGTGSNFGNGNVASKSEIYANRYSPTSAGQGLTVSSVGPDFKVRVQACASSALVGTENCKQYGSYLKPVGLLQQYGEDGTIHFGLMTGSYSKNKSGGVLRKNIGTITDEISQSTGQFLEPGTANALVVNPPSSSGYSSSGNPGIIKTLSRLRIYGYDFSAGNYGSGSDNCSAPNILDPADDRCTNWGNPISEIFTESLRYLAGKSATAAFTNSGSLSKDAVLGLPLAAWSDPLTSANYCAPLSALVFNSSVSSYDSDSASIADLFDSPSISSLTNAIGTGEGLSGSYMIGDNGSTSDSTCTPKAFSSLSALKGICPEAPMMSGSYLMAGAAYRARTTKIRDDFTLDTNDTSSLKVKTYGVALATNSPKIKIPVPGSTPTRYITVMPAFRVMSNSSTYNGPGEIVDFKVVRQSSDGTSGKFFVTWDDAPQGNDYDLDVWGYISYSFTDSTHIAITTEIVYAAQGYGSAFGFNISGVDSGNGVHYLTANRGSGNNVNIIWPTGCSGGGCEVNATSSNAWGPVSMSFGFSGSSSSGILEDPLWYTAKWGGFDDANENGALDSGEWDQQVNGTGSAGSDQKPDTFFFASDPSELENSLKQAFFRILQDSASSSVAASSSQLNTDTAIYQAGFSPSDWSGTLKAYKIGADGSIAATPLWDAAKVLNEQHYSSGRNIFTYDPSAATKGIPFRWTNLSSAQQAYLNRDPNNSNATDTNGALRLEYLRGSGANEGTDSTKFRSRDRTSNVNGTLGDIINSSPFFASAPNAGHAEDDYAGFQLTYKNRTKMIYVGGNDGMLHGFDAGSGTEKMAYMPNKLFSKLNQLTSRAYNSSHRYFVDGSPTVVDAYVNSGWKTILASGLGGGGRGIFALDVTNPDNFAESTANAGALALWEFTDADDSDLGFTFGQVAIVKVCASYSGGSCTSSKWAAVFGNGYNNTDATAGVASTTGKAALYVLHLDGGASGWSLGDNFFKITTTGSTATPNGLASPSPIDADGDGIIDFVYAGDLQGNLVRFDLTGRPSAWSYATLFAAKDSSGVAQPITSRPEVGRHSTGKGFMVYFGTGRYLATGDNATTGQQTQTFYGIWDKTTKSGDDWTLGGAVEGLRSAAGFHLLQQKVLSETADVRLTSDQVDDAIYKIDWKRTSPPAHTGWYIDLYNTGGGNTDNLGEKQVMNSVLQGRQIAFSTLIPDPTTCKAGGSGWLMKLDPDDGSRIDSGAFLDEAGHILTSTMTIGGVNTTVAVSGKKSTVGIPTTTTIVRDGNKIHEYTRGSKGDTQHGQGALLPYSGSRISWREILN